jgi:hypothetical protein
MRYGLFVLWMLFSSVPMATAQMSIGIEVPGASIGVSLPLFPNLVRVPGYPVYYAPRLNSNFFFYDGMYWVYQGDDWYTSSWYSGPWARVAPAVVPLYVLRVPVRYYRNPPPYFRGWRPEAPPRWGQHWGNEWERQRSGWDRWNRRSAPAPAPLPVYQRRYAGDRYPQAEQQPPLHSRNYHYQPHDAMVRPHYPEQRPQAAPPPERAQQRPPTERGPGQQDNQRSRPPALPPQPAQLPPPQERHPGRQDIPRSSARPPPQPGAAAVPPAQPPRRGGEDAQRSSPPQADPRQRGPANQDHIQQPQQPTVAPHERQPARSDRENSQHGKGAPQEGGRGQDKEHERGDERGQEHKK